MNTIVITGSTRGIGRGLATAFLEAGCQVVICGRTEQSVQQAIDELSVLFGAGQVWGQACEVSDYQSVQALWEAARAHFGRLDIWINNAGLSHPGLPFYQLDPKLIRLVADTNLLGVLNGCRVAIAGMMEQGGGRIFNLLGLGSNGMQVKGYALYGSTKYGLTYFTKALAREMSGSPVKVMSISPGMVTTGLLLDEYRKDPRALARRKFFFTLLADRVETVSPWLAGKILHSNRNGAHIAWLSKWKILSRILSLPFRRRRVLDGLV